MSREHRVDVPNIADAVLNSIVVAGHPRIDAGEALDSAAFVGGEADRRSRSIVLPRRWVLALFGVLAVFCIGGVFASAGRGPWVDEFWTVWQSRHDLSLAEVFRQRWAADFHPPLFSFLHWLLTPLVGEALLPHRLINFVPLAGAVSFAAFCARRYPRSFDVIGLYGLLLLSFPVALQYFSETRSYFWQLCVIYVQVGACVAIIDQGRDFDWRQDRALFAILVVSVVLGFNLHYFASLLSGIVVCAVAALAWRQGLRRWAGVLAGAAVVASVPLLAFVQTQSGFLSQESGHYWVTGGAREGFDRLTFALRTVLAGNAVISIAAVAVVMAWLDRVASRTRCARVFDGRFTAEVGPGQRRGQLLAVLGAAAVFYAVLLLVLHARQPIVYARYLIAFQTFTLALVALTAARLVVRWRAVAALALAFAIGSAALTAWRAGHEPRWDATAKAAAAAVKACPGATVRAVLQDRAKGSLNSQTVLRWAYERQGGLWGFRPMPLYAGGAVDPNGSCPAVFWVEHADPTEVTQAVAVPAIALRNFGLDPDAFDVARAKATAGTSGYVLVVPHRRAPKP